MTALDDRSPSPRQRSEWGLWEWREFEADGWAHLYRVAQLDNRRLDLLLPWCLLRAPFPLEHDRAGISPQAVLPQRGRTCPACGAHFGASIPHARTGTPVVGEFTGDLNDALTHRERW